MSRSFGGILQHLVSCLSSLAECLCRNVVFVTQCCCCAMKHAKQWSSGACSCTETERNKVHLANTHPRPCTTHTCPAQHTATHNTHLSRTTHGNTTTSQHNTHLSRTAHGNTAQQTTTHNTQQHNTADPPGGGVGLSQGGGVDIVHVSFLPSPCLGRGCIESIVCRPVRAVRGAERAQCAVESLPCVPCCLARGPPLPWRHCHGTWWCCGCTSRAMG